VRASSDPVTDGDGGNGEEGGAPNLSGKATLKEVSKIAQRNAEKELIEKVLGQTRWNRRKAAQILDISYKALLYKIKDCGLNMG
jgi:two-component system response regulator AtoC